MRNQTAKRTFAPPEFASDAEEARWWDHPENRADFWSHAEPVEVEPDERKDVVVSIRLRSRDATRLRKLAAARRMGHVTLLRRVVEQWIEHAPAAGGRGRQRKR